jgi:hypothetical protein
LTAAHAFGGLQRAIFPEGTHPTPGLDHRRCHRHDAADLWAGYQGLSWNVPPWAAGCRVVRTDEDIVASGGPGGAPILPLVLRPRPTHRFFNMKVREIICKPRL